ncbi:MAG: hypothetical protein ACE5JI_03360 [Acidobacteriota bacterium]
MQQHVKVLAVLYIVLSAMGVVAALLCLAIFGGSAGIVGIVAQEEPDARIAVPILGFLAVGLFIFLLTLSVPGIFAGVGLLKFRPWARILAIILSALNLMNFPLGTVLGIYGLWVLLSKETELLFRPGLPAQTGDPP